MRMLRGFSSLLVLLMVLTQSAMAEKVATLPKPTGYIDDYASLLSIDARRQAEDLCVELHRKTRAQVFVVTIGSLEGETIEAFAHGLFHKWRIGEKKTNRGVLLLFAANDRKYRIEVGYGFEGILNDARAGDIGRLMVPSLKAGNYDEAVQTGLDLVAQAIADDAKVQLDGSMPQHSATAGMGAPAVASVTPVAVSTGAPPGLVMLIVVLVLLAVLVIAMVMANNSDPEIIRPQRPWQNDPYGPSYRGFWASGGNTFNRGGGGFMNSGDTSSGSDFSGGGDSGGGCSSGGDSGSGGDFSGGGGGDSGGGGASGSW